MRGLDKLNTSLVDKTGTLTCNKMEFKICITGDEMFGDASMVMNEGETIKRQITHKDEKERVGFSFNDKNLIKYVTDEYNKGKVDKFYTNLLGIVSFHISIAGLGL